MGSSSSRPDTAATKRDVDSRENRYKFIHAKEPTTYDNLLLDGSISNADVRDKYGNSGLHRIPATGIDNKDVNTEILLSYLLTCDPPADVNGRSGGGFTPMWWAAAQNETSAVKVLIDFGGDRTIKTVINHDIWPNKTPLDIAKDNNDQEIDQEIIKLLTETLPSEE